MLRLHRLTSSLFWECNSHSSSTLQSSFYSCLYREVALQSLTGPTSLTDVSNLCAPSADTWPKWRVSLTAITTTGSSVSSVTPASIPQWKYLPVSGPVYLIYLLYQTHGLYVKEYHRHHENVNIHSICKMVFLTWQPRISYWYTWSYLFQHKFTRKRKLKIKFKRIPKNKFCIFFH